MWLTIFHGWFTPYLYLKLTRNTNGNETPALCKQSDGIIILSFNPTVPYREFVSGAQQSLSQIYDVASPTKDNPGSSPTNDTIVTKLDINLSCWRRSTSTAFLTYITSTHNLLLSSTVLYLLLLAFVNKPLFVWIIHSWRWGTEHNGDTVIVSVLNKRCLLSPFILIEFISYITTNTRLRKLFSGQIMAKVTFMSIEIYGELRSES